MSNPSYFSNDNKVIHPFEGANFGDLFTIIPENEKTTFPFPYNSKAKVSCYMSLHNTENVSMYVKPSQKVLDWIFSNMLAIDYDTVYFRCIIFKDGSASIYASYNQIIGSRLLTWIDSKNILSEGE